MRWMRLKTVCRVYDEAIVLDSARFEVATQACGYKRRRRLAQLGKESRPMIGSLVIPLPSTLSPPLIE